ncbi:DNA polymerase III subunit gamma/tau [Bacteroidales bacterium]|nr:DNA polymerase III subunit gamma/tau [Bacteroidales bacterium]
MDNYIVSARKYRPDTFKSVIGQKSLTTTLKNAVKNNKLAHAYLFCGPRGVGKTTCARIFAKTINCLSPLPDGDACNVCECCTSFNENRSYNIHELDAASNNSVDDIRLLIEHVRIAPSIGKYNVYIIDEVHMLSSSAFNAFLKTLEEPPHYVVFILATTEKHKLLPTILSRCQIYDFNRISINDIVGYLTYVTDQEGVVAEVEALNIIAQKSDGGMRDALSILDQVISFTEGHITYKSVIDNLNVLDYEYYFRLTDLFMERNIPQCMLVLDEILIKGFDGQHILSGLAAFFRDLLVCKDPQTLVLFEVGVSVQEKYKNCASKCSNDFLYRAIEMTNESDYNYRASRNKRLLTELLLIRICQLNKDGQEIDDNKKKNLIEPIFTAAPESKEQAGNIVKEITTRVQEDANPLAASSLGDKKAPSPLAKVVSGASLRISMRAEVERPKDNLENKEVAQMHQATNNSFTEEELLRSWHAYANSLIEKIHLKNTMLNISPSLGEDYKIEVAVYNPEQSQKLQEEATSLMQFLRKELQNTSIHLEVVLSDENKKKLAYTDSEKYQLMSSLNPSLEKLVAEFDLKLD